MLNHARANAEWGKQAVFLLIEVYLNIDKDLVSNEVAVDGADAANEECIKAAWKLLGESRYNPHYQSPFLMYVSIFPGLNIE
jgi:hypothetical protein